MLQEVFPLINFGPKKFFSSSSNPKSRMLGLERILEIISACITHRTDEGLGIKTQGNYVNYSWPVKESLTS